MKKMLVCFAAVVAVMTTSAQIVEVQSVRKLDTPSSDAAARVAAFSPDGSYLLLTARDNRGLVRFNLSDGQSVSLSEAMAAGAHVRIARDSRSVTYREAVLDADHNNVYALMRRDFTARTPQRMQAPTRDLNRLNGAEQEVEAYINTDLQLVLRKNGETRILSPQGTQYAYIWAEMSPDGTKISYYCSELGGFVCDLQGHILHSVGTQCHDAHWMDNNTLVGMDFHSDGKVITGGEITACTLDGRFQRLTDKEHILLYPRVAGKHIACSTPVGEIYMIDVK